VSKKVDPRDQFPEVDGITEYRRPAILTLAVLLVGTYCLLATFLVVFATVRNVVSVSEMLSALGWLFGGPLGYVLGFYFGTRAG